MEARELANMGSRIHEAEKSVLRAIDGIQRACVDPVPQNLELMAEASLLLGRIMRLRCRSEAAVWVHQAVKIYSELVRSSHDSSVAAARLCEGLNHLTLIQFRNEKNGASRRLTDRAFNNQRQAYSELRHQTDPDDALMESLHRAIEIVSWRSGPHEAIRFMYNSDFLRVTAVRPDHNRALRLIYYGNLLTATGELDSAWEQIVSAAAFGARLDSQYLSINILEQKARFMDAVGDCEYSQDFREEARRLRSIEEIDG
ncbi:hypothetical protein [Streptomonospora alba]|uniref:hypothetical protein n=1 Tax=Streptomonospora alba TaxID=183763 RepID=UPI0012ED829A|nr:hypothetical protein [Streptomonospora alba]